MANIIVGGIFFAIVGYGAYKSLTSMKNNTCPGCSGGCSQQQRKSCKHGEVDRIGEIAFLNTNHSRS